MSKQPRYDAFIVPPHAARGLCALELGIQDAQLDRAVENLCLELVEIVLDGGRGVELGLRTVARSFFYYVFKTDAHYDAGI